MDTQREISKGSVGPPRWGVLLDRFGRYPIVALVYVFIKYRLGMDSVIRAHDNLDHFAAVYDRMSLADVFAAPGATLDFVLGGLPRDVVGSELFVGTLTGAVFPLLWAMVVSELVTRGVAYYGMRRLLRATDLASERVVYLAVPLLFSILPFHHPVVASVAGIPLLLSALIQLHRRPGRVDFAILALFPIMSWAGATVPYVVLVLGYAIGGRMLRLVPVAVLKGAAVLAGALVVIEWRLVYSVLAGPESHRLEIGRDGGGVLDLAALSGRVFSLGRTLLELVEKHAEHAFSAVGPASIALVVGVVAWVLVSRRDPDPAVRSLVVVLVGIAAILVGARVWPYVDTNVVARIVELPPFQMDRIGWAVPALSYLALAAGSVALLRMAPGRLGITTVVVVFLLQGIAAWRLADFNTTDRAQLTINEFYAPDVFAEVASIIEQDSGGGLVVSIGFHPHVAVYNGLDTADGYWYNYPLEYKHRFRALIAPALAAAPDLAAYFDGWGSRAYVFQPALGNPDCCVVATPTPYQAVLDVAAFDDLNIGYVLSNGEVTNAGELGLEPLGVASGSLYTIHVYATGR